MEKKTNKEKLAIFKFLQFYRKAIAFDKIGKLCLICKFYKDMLIRVFLHAEFISAMKTVQNPTIFVKNAKKQKNDQFWQFLLIF